MAERVVVVVSDDRSARIETVAEGLRSAGMRVDRVLEVVGVIVGTAPDVGREPLLRVPGVVAVEGEDTFGLPQ